MSNSIKRYSILMNGKKAKSTRRAAKMLIDAAGSGDERRTYKRMKAMIKTSDVRSTMYGR